MYIAKNEELLANEKILQEYEFIKDEAKDLTIEYMQINYTNLTLSIIFIPFMQICQCLMGFVSLPKLSRHLLPGSHPSRVCPTPWGDIADTRSLSENHFGFSTQDAYTVRGMPKRLIYLSKVKQTTMSAFCESVKFFIFSSIFRFTK